MAKVPLPGLAKTRLCPPLSPSGAASLAMCFVQDVIESALRVNPHVILAYTPTKGRAILEPALPAGLQWLEQQGDNLAERLVAAIAYAYDQGFAPIIVLGTDSPTLPPAFIEQAFGSLSTGSADVVLGPTVDGGYYLVGVRKPEPNIFHDIAWSSPDTFKQTARNVRQLNFKLLTLEQWYDVDTFTDLQSLNDELLRDPNTRERAPQTYRWLSSHKLA